MLTNDARTSPIFQTNSCRQMSCSATESEDDDGDGDGDGYSQIEPTLKPALVPDDYFSWVNPKLEARCCDTGHGLYAIQPISKNEDLIVWTGKIISAEQALAVMSTEDKHYLLQIADGFYQSPLSDAREPADWTNHSCDPNAGFGKHSPILLSAMRDIQVGEQILFDYSMCETDPRLWEPMDCMCGTPFCRAKITANDWYLHPQLWDRYKGFWAPHVQVKIDEYKAQLATAGDTTDRRFSASKSEPVSSPYIASPTLVGGSPDSSTPPSPVSSSICMSSKYSTASNSDLTSEKQPVAINNQLSSDLSGNWMDRVLSRLGLLRASS